MSQLWSLHQSQCVCVSVGVGGRENTENREWTENGKGVGCGGPTHAFNSNIQRQEDIHEFKASSVYRVSSKTARTIQREPVFKIIKKRKKKMVHQKLNEWAGTIGSHRCWVEGLLGSHESPKLLELTSAKFLVLSREPQRGIQCLETNNRLVLSHPREAAFYSGYVRTRVML